MFNDILIVEKFSTSTTKCNYLINCGFADYFTEKLIKFGKDWPCFFISYNDSLNNVLQKNRWQCS